MTDIPTETVLHEDDDCIVRLVTIPPGATHEPPPRLRRTIVNVLDHEIYKEDRSSNGATRLVSPQGHAATYDTPSHHSIKNASNGPHKTIVIEYKATE